MTYTTSEVILMIMTVTTIHFLVDVALMKKNLRRLRELLRLISNLNSDFGEIRQWYEDSQEMKISEIMKEIDRQSKKSDLEARPDDR